MCFMINQDPERNVLLKTEWAKYPNVGYKKGEISELQFGAPALRQMC